MGSVPCHAARAPAGAGGDQWRLQPWTFLSRLLSSPEKQMQIVRWLYLSGLVFATLIPAGWQMDPEDLDDTSRYGALVELVRGDGRHRQALSQQLSPLRYRCCRLSRLRGYCNVPVSFVLIRTSSLLALYQPTQGHCHVSLPGLLGCVRPETGCTGTRRGRVRTGRCFGQGAEPHSAPAAAWEENPLGTFCHEPQHQLSILELEEVDLNLGAAPCSLPGAASRDQGGGTNSPQPSKT